MTLRTAQRAAEESLNALLAFDGPEQRPAAERCLGAAASQPPMLSTLANNLHQIVQTSDTTAVERFRSIDTRMWAKSHFRPAKQNDASPPGAAPPTRP